MGRVKVSFKEAGLFCVVRCARRCPVMIRIGPVSATRLPIAPDRSLTASNTSVEQPPEPSASEASDKIRRQFTIEPVSREVVFLAIDLESGEVIRQQPDVNYLRNRAYARLLAEQSVK